MIKCLSLWNIYWVLINKFLNKIEIIFIFCQDNYSFGPRFMEILVNAEAVYPPDR